MFSSKLFLLMCSFVATMGQRLTEGDGSRSAGGYGYLRPGYNNYPGYGGYPGNNYPGYGGYPGQYPGSGGEYNGYPGGYGGYGQGYPGYGGYPGNGGYGQGYPGYGGYRPGRPGYPGYSGYQPSFGRPGYPGSGYSGFGDGFGDFSLGRRSNEVKRNSLSQSQT